MDVRSLMRRAAGHNASREALVHGDVRLTFAEAWERGLRLANADARPRAPVPATGSASSRTTAWSRRRRLLSGPRCRQPRPGAALPPQLVERATPTCSATPAAGRCWSPRTTPRRWPGSEDGSPPTSSTSSSATTATSPGSPATPRTDPDPLGGHRTTGTSSATPAGTTGDVEGGRLHPQGSWLDNRPELVLTSAAGRARDSLPPRRPHLPRLRIPLHAGVARRRLANHMVATTSTPRPSASTSWERERIGFLFAVPTILSMLARHPSARGRDWSALKVTRRRLADLRRHRAPRPRDLRRHPVPDLRTDRGAAGDDDGAAGVVLRRSPGPRRCARRGGRSPSPTWRSSARTEPPSPPASPGRSRSARTGRWPASGRTPRRPPSGW